MQELNILSNSSRAIFWPEWPGSQFVGAVNDPWRQGLGYTEGGIFEARVSPGSFLYLYIFLHLLHMFLHMLFVFVV